MLKKIIISFGVLFLLFVGGIVVAPSFIDWNARLPEISAQVKNATGRTLTITGKLDVRIFPAPMVTARGVKFGNVQGGSAVNMVELDAVEVRVAFLPLLSGQLQVERINLVNPVIVIEKLADGRTNLDFQGTARPTGMTKSSSAKKSGTNNFAAGLGIRLDNFELKNATLIYKDIAKDKSQRVEHLNATFRAGSLQGPFQAKGQAQVRKIPLAFDVSLGQIISGRTVPLEATVRAPGNAVVKVSGAILGMEAVPHFKGKVKIQGDNFARLVDELVGKTVSLRSLAQKFSIDGVVKASATAVDVSELEVQLATTRLRGAVGLDLSKGTEFDVKLKASRVDLDALLGASGQSLTALTKARLAGDNTNERMAPAPPSSGVREQASTGFQFPKNVSGTVQLVVDAVTLKQGLVSNVRLNAELADGELALSQFQLQAPGVTDLALFGFVRPQNGIPKFEGNLEFLTSDPKGLANWLGVKVPPGVSNRLKRVSFTTTVQADTKEVVLGSIRLVGDRSTVTGGVTVALRARPSFGADLNLDTLNLDTYLGNSVLGKPQNAMTSNQQTTVASPSVATSERPKNATFSAMDALKAWTALQVLNDFDANLKIHVGALTLKGQTFSNVLTDGTLYAGTLDLRSLSLGDLKGATGKISGTFNGFGGIVEMTNVKVRGQVKNASSLARSFGIDGVPKSLRKVQVNSSVSGSILKPKITLKVNALGGEYGAKGRFSFLPIGFGYEGTFNVRHPDAVRLFSSLNLGYTPKGPLGKLDLKGVLTTNGKTHTITNLNGTIGDMDLSGTVQARMDGGKPTITANLNTGLLNVDGFLPRPREDVKKQASAAQPPHFILASYTAQNNDGVKVAEVIDVSRVNKRWSRNAFDLGILNTVNADVTLVAKGIQFGDYRLDNADIHARVEDGIMTADRLKGTLFGGAVNGTAEVRADGQPTLKTNIVLNALDIRRAVKVVAGKDLAGGKLGLTVDFQATGNSPALLVRSLGGKGDLRIRKLDVKQSGSGTALSGIIGLVGAMNKLSLSAIQGRSKDQADVGLSFNIADGVATVNDFALTSGLGTGMGAGTIDLAQWTIDFAGKMKIEANLLTALLSKGRIKIQEIPFSLKGNLDKPGVNFASAPSGRSVTKTPSGRSATTKTPSGQPATKALSPVQQMMQKFLPGILPQQKQPTPQKIAPSSPTPKSPPQSTPGNGVLAPPPSQQSGGTAPQTSPAAPGKLTPEEMIRRLLQGM